MPSQEEYLDNLLKGIETENMETEGTKAGACGRDWNSGRYERYG